MERTNDPVRDADHYFREREEEKNKPYMVTVNFEVKIPISAKNNSDAAWQAEQIESDLSAMIKSAKGDYEIDEVEPGCTTWEEID
jgi:hypothetical protein